MPQFTIPIYVDRSGRMRKAATFPEFYDDGDNKFRLKRKDTARLAIYFLDDDLSPYRLDDGATVVVGVKEDGKFDADYLISASTDERPATDADPYIITLLVAADDLDTLLGVDSDEDNDVASINTMFEISWTEDGSTNSSSVNPVGLTIFNDVVRDDQAFVAPVALATTRKFCDTFNQVINTSMVRDFNWAEIFGLEESDLASIRVTLMSKYHVSLTTMQNFVSLWQTHIMVHNDSAYQISPVQPELASIPTTGDNTVATFNDAALPASYQGNILYVDVQDAANDKATTRLSLVHDTSASAAEPEAITHHLCAELLCKSNYDITIAPVASSASSGGGS